MKRRKRKTVRRPRRVTSHAAAVKFFMKHAGSSYIPGKETRAQGKRRSAIALANKGYVLDGKDVFYVTPYSRTSKRILGEERLRVLAQIEELEDL